MIFVAFVLFQDLQYRKVQYAFVTAATTFIRTSKFKLLLQQTDELTLLKYVTTSEHNWPLPSANAVSLFTETWLLSTTESKNHLQCMSRTMYLRQFLEVTIAKILFCWFYWFYHATFPLLHDSFVFEELIIVRHVCLTMLLLYVTTLLFSIIFIFLWKRRRLIHTMYMLILRLWSQDINLWN